jgi:hypothetical protein
MQAVLVKVAGQDRDGRLHLDQQVSERLPRRGTERADHPDLVGMSGHQGLLQDRDAIVPSPRASPGTTDATGIHKLEAEQPDPRQQAVQRGLIELSGDDRDPAVRRQVQAGEGRLAGLIERTGEADLVGKR